MTQLGSGTPPAHEPRPVVSTTVGGTLQHSWVCRFGVLVQGGDLSPLREPAPHRFVVDVLASLPVDQVMRVVYLLGSKQSPALARASTDWRLLRLLRLLRTSVLLQPLRRIMGMDLGAHYMEIAFVGRITLLAMARPAPFASCSVRRALLTPQVNPGFLYRCGRST